MLGGQCESMLHVEKMVVVSFKPVVGQVNQFIECSAAAVAGDDLVEMPPDKFDRVDLLGVTGQEVDRNSVSSAVRGLKNQLAVVERRIVADHINPLEALQSATQVFQVSGEQLGVLPVGRLTDRQRTGPPKLAIRRDAA